MPKVNDISKLKIATSTQLAQVGKKSGRKKKPASEKESKTITLKVTPAEFEHLESMAGLAALGTYVKHYLRTNSDLFSVETERD